MGRPCHNVDPYREFFEHFADALLIIENGRFVDCNRAAVEMLGFNSMEELLQTHPSELSPPSQPDGRDSREKADEMIALAFELGSHRFDWNHVRADGRVVPVEVLLTALEIDGRSILQVNWRDISDRKRLEEELRHAQKMEALGVLAGGIAHDFNNLLVAILGHSDLLEMSLEDEPELLEHVVEIQKAGDRAASLIRQLLAFSRKHDVQLSVTDLNKIVLELTKMLRRLIGENVQFEVQRHVEALIVRVDVNQMEQVVFNLVTNARDAVRDGGEIIVGLSEIIIPSGHEILEPGRYANLRVQDTGAGMDSETLEHAFDPFFTTKDQGRGTGLGLSTVYGIVQEFGGSVTIESKPDLGTVVDVRVPIHEGDETHQPGHVLSAATGGEETILVVEDEAAVMNVVTRLLERKGYRLLTASDGVEALEVVERCGQEIDLVLTDVVMPRMGGVELVRALNQKAQTPKVLFMTAYARHDTSDLKRLSGNDLIIEKPFAKTELARRVRQVLDGGSEEESSLV